MKKKPVIPGSLAWEAQQLTRAIAKSHEAVDVCAKPCSICHRAPRACSKGKTYSYCVECRKKINRERYAKVKKNK